jgi:hypothetical protein
MKKLILILILISLSVIKLQAQEEVTGLAGFHLSYDINSEVKGYGFEVGGFGEEWGFGFRADIFPNDSLSFSSLGAFLLYPVTENFLIKISGGAIIQNPKEKRYPDGYLFGGFGFISVHPRFYWGIQCNTNVEVNPILQITIGRPFGNNKKSD